jgi:hypothetical protein
MKSLALLVALAAADPSPPLQTTAPAAPEAMMKKRAGDAVKGYYKALIAADYDAAATFLKSDAVEPVRAELAKQIEAAAPAQQKATLEMFGVADVAALRALPYTKFFAAYARSKYGLQMQQLARKDLGAAVVVDDTKCTIAEKKCAVSFTLTLTAEGKPAKVPQQMLASDVEGRWLLGFSTTPPAGR